MKADIISMISWSMKAYRLPMCSPPLQVGERVIGHLGVGNEEVEAVIEEIREVNVKAGKVEMFKDWWEQCFPPEMGDFTFHSLSLICFNPDGLTSSCGAPAGVVRRVEDK